MASVELHQSNCYSGDVFPRSIPRQSHPHALQNTAAPPSANNGQLEGYVHHSVRGTDVPDGLQGPHNINEVDHGIVDHHPLSLDVPAVPYLFPDVGFGQGILAQVQPDAPPEDQHALFRHAQHILPGPAQAAFPDPFARQPPTPGKSPSIFGSSLFITCIIPVLRLIWSAWNRAPRVVLKWWYNSQWLVLSMRRLQGISLGWEEIMGCGP
ncbi:hypothetical protein BC826DRAFT_601422 [Russula brevipes]|nr:hypothetical protein BC826DRAFT_601422 [Russula brevipes]